MKAQLDLSTGPRRQRRRPSSLRRLVAAGVGLVLLVVAVPNLGPALRAARAEGTPGTFTAEELRCVRHPGHEACTWYGTFRPAESGESDGGGTAVETSLYGGRHGLEEGDTAPAVDVGRGSRVYPPTGSREWIATVLLIVAGLALLAPLALSSIAHLRLPHAERRSPRSFRGRDISPERDIPSTEPEPQDRH